MSKIYIVRGLPNSGKSTYAKKFGVLHVEADMFFQKNLEYQFNPNKISDAHNFCSNIVEQAMIYGVDVVVSNTFTKKWEFIKYIDLAEKYNYNVEVVRCTGEFGNGNGHSVPDEAIKRMKDRFEDYEGEIIIDNK